MNHTIAKKNVFTVQDIPTFKQKAFAWANAFDVFCYLDNNGYTEGYQPPAFEALIGIGCRHELTLDAENDAFEKLRAFRQVHAGWLFGYLSYDLKNAVENLESSHFDGHQMPVLHFFEPKIVLKIGDDAVEIVLIDSLLALTTSEQAIFEAILKTPSIDAAKPHAPLNLQPRIAKDAYLETVRRIQAHILRGDIFEMNFCQEFFAENATIHPFALFQALNALARAPFSAFYRYQDRYILCASPERFLKKDGQKLISQPIKGTARRSTDAREDAAIKTQLQNDPKNRAENVMIVDLVRNDLGKICAAGTVRVPELFGVYTFPTVH